jgi:hypothetical protein
LTELGALGSLPLTLTRHALFVRCMRLSPAITKQPCHGGSIDQTLSVEDCVNGWLERVLSTDMSWSVPHGVTIDIGPCELRDFLRRWKERRIDSKYSWKNFVDIERHDGGASDPFSAALARCH